MGTRILNRQRKMTEQGRLRFGVYTGTRPKALTTWIVSSHSEPHVRAAAHLWGGDVERWQPQGNGAQQWRVITEASTIPAILPTGDPLNTAYELWTRGGCQRRCDGVLEKLSGSPCICRTQFGEDFHEQKPGTVCGEKTRLSVYLPDMPGLGVWRMETGSYWGTDEIVTGLDDIRGAVGDGVLIPVLLRLEQRTKVSKGETKQFVVPIMDLQGATFGELLAGSVAARSSHAVEHAERRAVEGSRPAIAAAAEPVERAEKPYLRRIDVLDAIRHAGSRDHVIELWQQAKAEDDPRGAEIEAAAKARVAELEKPAEQGGTKLSAEEHIKAAFRATTLDQLTAALDRAQAEGYAQDLTDADDTVAAAFMGRRQLLSAQETPVASAPASPDPEALWLQIVSEAGGRGFDRTDDIEKAFATRWNGDQPGAASVTQLQTFLDELRDGKVRPPQPSSVAADDENPPF